MAWARRALLAGDSAPQRDPRPAEVVLLLVDRLEAMLEHTTDMITVLGPEGDIRYSNRAAGVLTGHTESVNGTNAAELIHPEDLDRAFAALGRCLERDGGMADTEIRLRHADGSWHHVEAHARNCLSDPVAGVVVTMRDICARKQGEAALVEANEAMREFVAVASHELRTPTSVINGFATGLIRGWDATSDEDRRAAVEAIARSSSRLAHLVEDLLTLSALDAGAVVPGADTCRVADVVRETVDGLDLVDVRVNVLVDLRVQAGSSQVARVVRNYLENAVRYGAAPYAVEASIDGPDLVLRVSDAGEGVDPSFAPHLFERFARADTSRSRATGGTGLGLAIVRSLARGWGGEAWFEQPALGGSCFAVRIPLAPPAPH